METLIVKKATKKDLGLLLEYAQKIGVEVLVAPKERIAPTPKPDKKKLAEIVSKINKAATKRMLAVHNL